MSVQINKAGYKVRLKAAVAALSDPYASWKHDHGVSRLIQASKALKATVAVLLGRFLSSELLG